MDLRSRGNWGVCLVAAAPMFAPWHVFCLTCINKRMRILTMSLRSLIFFSLFLILACGRPVSAVPRGGGASSAADVEKLREAIVKLVNEYRKEEGKPALKTNAVIEQIADQHSADMAGGRTGFGHDGFEARNKELKDKLGGIKAMAENVAFGKLSADRVVELWLGSTGHRRNIEGDYNLTGIGIARAENGQLYFTQIFVRK